MYLRPKSCWYYHPLFPFPRPDAGRVRTTVRTFSGYYAPVDVGSRFTTQAYRGGKVARSQRARNALATPAGLLTGVECNRLCVCPANARNRIAAKGPSRKPENREGIETMRAQALGRKIEPGP